VQFSAPIFTGFAATSLPQLGFAAFCMLLGLMVLKNKRWAMWLSFFAVLFGGIAGMAGYFGGSTIPIWASLLIWVVSWVAAACLFLVLWRNHESGAFTHAE
jgi:hypothetical protein